MSDQDDQNYQNCQNYQDDKPALPLTNGPQTVVSEPPPAGRTQRGRFALGNPGGPGNPLAAEVGKHRARLFKAARADDIDQALETIREVMSKGKDGDRLAAARLLLDRLIGPAVELDLIERLERLEEAILGSKENVD